MARPSLPVTVRFRHDAWDEAVARAEALAAGGHGWMNLRPTVVDPDSPGHTEAALDEAELDLRPARAGIFGILFSSPTPVVPMATWVVAGPGGRGTAGIEHGHRNRVLPLLLEQGAGPPAGSVRTQDHARRGLVVTLPGTVEATEVLAWLMEAVDVLCPLPLTGDWQLDLHTD